MRRTKGRPATGWILGGVAVIGLLILTAWWQWGWKLRPAAELTLQQLTVPAHLTVLAPESGKITYVRSAGGALEPLRLTFDQRIDARRPPDLMVFVNGAPVVALPEQTKQPDRAAGFLYRFEGKDLYLWTSPGSPSPEGTIWLVMRTGESAPKVVAGLSTEVPNAYDFLESGGSYLSVPLAGDGELKVAVAARTATLADRPGGPARSDLPPLSPGDTVVVKEPVDQWVRVRVYPNQGVPAGAGRRESAGLEADFLSLAGPGQEGFLPRTALVELARPLNARSLVVGRLGESGTAEVALFAFPVGVATVPVQTRSVVTTEVVEALEARAMLQWQDLPGRSYWSIYVDEQGRQVGMTNPSAHLPEGGWSDQEYRWYRAARDAYLSALEALWEQTVLPSALLAEKQALQERLIAHPARLQDAWIQWGALHRTYSAADFAQILRSSAPMAASCSQCDVGASRSDQELDTAWGKYINSYLSPDSIRTLQQFVTNRLTLRP